MSTTHQAAESGIAIAAKAAPANTVRQALRDITAQPGFPWSVDWPVAP